MNGYVHDRIYSRGSSSGLITRLCMVVSVTWSILQNMLRLIPPGAKLPKAVEEQCSYRLQFV